MKYFLPVLSVILLSSRLTFGQDTIKISFDEAVKIALQNNIQLKQEMNNLESAVALERQSKAQFLPNISASSQMMHIYGQQFDLIKGGLYFKGSDRANGSLTAYYTLFNGLGRLNNVRKYDDLRDSQENFVDRTEQQIIFNVAEQFLQTLLDRELLRIASENLNNQKTTLQQIAGFVEAGTRPLSDKLNQEAEVQRLEVLKIRAENKLRLDRAILSQSLMMDAGVEINPLEPDWGFETILAQDYNLDELYKNAIANRPDFKKAMTDEAASQAGVGAMRAFHYPMFNLFFDYGSGYSSLAIDQTTNETVPFRQQFFKDNLYATYGMQINIPIFDQYKTISQKTQAKMTMENLKLAEQNLKLTIYREVQNAYLNLVAAKNEYFATQSQFTAAVEANKIQQERYEVGVGDLVELSTANQRYIEAAASRGNAQYTLLFQKVILEYYTGELKAENLH